MEAILMKYKEQDREYLVYDSLKYQAKMQPRAVLSIFAHNFGLGVSGLMVGPFLQGGSLTMKVFSPDGRERPLDGGALEAGQCYLKDAGYIQAEKEAGEKSAGKACVIGKVFLSPQFVNTYMDTDMRTA